MTATSDVKPIETSYAGHLFRSRLEARWAVAFNHLQVEWQYEPQGYDLDGLRYLPDFYLPVAACGPIAGGCHVEVKGQLADNDLDKLTRFARLIGPVLLVGDLPKSEALGPHFHVFHRERRTGDDVIVRRVSLFQWATPTVSVEPHGWPSLPIPPQADRVILDNLQRWLIGEWHESMFARAGVVDLQTRIARAFHAGRTARFEHGASGAPSC